MLRKSPHRNESRRSLQCSLAFAGLVALSIPQSAFGQQLLRNFSASSYPTEFTVFDGAVYFVGQDDVTGREIWRTDGTAAGTEQVTQLGTGPSSLTAANGSLYFVAALGGQYALWQTDGTPAGTQPVVPTGGPDRPSSLTDLNGLLVFSASDSATGMELWASDGSAAGTVLLKDIRPGTAGSTPRNLTVMNGHILFTANDGVSGEELWITDGTPEGTILYLDIQSGPASSFPTLITPVSNTRFYFVADHPSFGKEVWYLENFGGLLEGYGPVDLYPGTGGSSPSALEALNGLLVFAADDGVHGEEPWTHDGTGATLLSDIAPGTANSSASRFTAAGSHLYFAADDGTTGYEPWVTDGTAAGTRLLFDVRPGSSSSLPPLGRKHPDFSVFQGHVLFAAHDGVNDREPWITDGTAEGTRLAYDVHPTGAGFTRFSAFSYLVPGFTALGNTLVFAANDGAGNGVWSIDAAQIAHCVLRNGSGINPADYSCTSPPVLGGRWKTHIRSISTTATIALGISTSAVPGTPLFGGELLINVATPTVFLTSRAPRGQGFDIPIPGDSTLLGAQLATQGFRIDQVGSGQLLVPLNALDLTLGR